MNLVFMGTAGARFMVFKQITASGGIYLEHDRQRVAMDPGPGAVVQYSKRKVDLTRLTGVLLSHKHLDHSTDMNVVIEGMTDGGFHRRGTVFCPPDALDPDPVIFPYLRGFPEAITELEPHTDYDLGSLHFRTSRKHPHNFPDRPSVDTFGFVFQHGLLGWVTDTRYYDGIEEEHQAEVMILHTVIEHGRPELPHLGLDDAERIITAVRPKLAVITHFGMGVWRRHPWEVAADLEHSTGVAVKAARDGLRLDVDAVVSEGPEARDAAAG
ncbi:MAG: MBL fold metallo-hydrolase [Candidatus Dormibacteraeota bacterium]|nr:MBL fold metallo-hydrolase [Candidatus Dormibacteraeota bacterium]